MGKKSAAVGRRRPVAAYAALASAAAVVVWMLAPRRQRPEEARAARADAAASEDMAVNAGPLRRPVDALVTTTAAVVPRADASLASLFDELRANGGDEPAATTENTAAPKNTAPQKETPKKQPSSKKETAMLKKERVLVFTMDSTSQYEKNAKKGGASGEITIRRSLERALEDAGVEVDVAVSDADFERRCPSRGTGCDAYRALVLDAWTWAAPGWVAKPNLRGREQRVYLLDFFGASEPRNRGINVPASRILTAYPTFPGNTFLGFAFEDQPGFAKERALETAKKPQVVVWGKDTKYLAGKTALLVAVSKLAQLHFTVSSPPPSLTTGLDNEPVFHGHLSKDEWHALLAESKAVLGLGDPLLGPTGLDALAHGCVYVDPAYPKPVKGYHSQHPYLRERYGPPYVCAATLDHPPSYVACVKDALTRNLPPLVPDDFSLAAHRRRVHSIFHLSGRDSSTTSTSTSDQQQQQVASSSLASSSEQQHRPSNGPGHDRS